MFRCDSCGKFRKLNDLKGHYTPDTHFTAEEIWHECKFCEAKGRKMTDFEKELQALINRHSMENTSNTPDWILAQYLESCLRVFTTATQQREHWYGRDPRPSMAGSKLTPPTTQD